MRRGLCAIAFAMTGCTLTACAAISGLDEITESDCVPDGCPDAAAGGQATQDGEGDGGPGVTADGAATPASGRDASNDASLEGDPSSGDDTADAGGDSDGGGPLEDEGGAISDATSDAIDDAAADALFDAPADAPALDSGCGAVYFQESFANDAQGWTLDPSWSIAPECASPPAPQKGHPDPTTDHTGAPSSGVVGAYVCGNVPSGQTAAFRYATSPPVDVSSAPTLELSFWRWLNTDASEWMASTVDVFDGTRWVNVFTNPSGAGNLVTDGAWTRQQYDVTAQKNAAFRVRFGYEVLSASAYAMSGWNVDDVTISTASCP